MSETDVDFYVFPSVEPEINFILVTFRSLSSSVLQFMCGENTGFFFTITSVDACDLQRSGLIECIHQSADQRGDSAYCSGERYVIPVCINT